MNEGEQRRVDALRMLRAAVDEGDGPEGPFRRGGCDPRRDHPAVGEPKLCALRRRYKSVAAVDGAGARR
jgi:hypothetical protein